MIDYVVTSLVGHIHTVIDYVVTSLVGHIHS